MNNLVAAEHLNKIFQDAHTAQSFAEREVPFDTIFAAWEHAKWAPTAFNSQPLRISIVPSGPARDRLVPLMSPGNRDKTANAPLSLILAWDPDFPTVMGNYGTPDSLVKMLSTNPALGQSTGTTSAWIQMGYLLVALRAVGLDIGPMTGADMTEIDLRFHDKNGWKALAVVNVGYTGADNYFPRAGRPQRSDVITIAN